MAFTVIIPTATFMNNCSLQHNKNERFKNFNIKKSYIEANIVFYNACSVLAQRS